MAFKNLVLDSWLNLLVLCAPLGWAAHFAGWNAYATFLLNLICLVPLAMIIGKLTEDLATRYGDTIGAPQGLDPGTLSAHAARRHHLVWCGVVGHGSLRASPAGSVRSLTP